MKSCIMKQSKNMESVLNFECDEFSANEELELFLQNVEVAATQGYDGFVVEPRPEIFDSLYETLIETGIPYMSTLLTLTQMKTAPTSFRRSFSTSIRTARTQTQWFYDHYQDYWGNVDASKIVLLSIEYSTNPDLDERARGVKDKFDGTLPRQ